VHGDRGVGCCTYGRYVPSENQKRLRFGYSFFYPVGHGRVNLYTFHTLEEAAWFAKNKIHALTTLELSIIAKSRDSVGNPKITPMSVPNSERRKNRA